METNTERQTAEDIVSGKISIENMSIEDLKNLKAQLNVLKIKKDLVKSGECACISIVQIGEIFQRRLVTTAMLGYQARQIQGYTPRKQIKIIEDRFNRLAAEIDSAEEVERLGAECAAQVKKITTVTRQVLEEFYRETFLFDPDRSIRAAAIAEKCNERGEGSGAIPECVITPPVDAKHYHDFDRYITQHYDSLVDITEKYYSEKSEFANMFIYYGSHPSEEAARKWINMNEDNFNLDVAVVSTGITNVTPTKANREKTSYGGRESEILQQIQEQARADHRLGNDLMRKRVKDSKRDTVEKFGPDVEELEKYIDVTSTINELGAKRVMTREEQIRIKEAKDLRDALEVPENAIQYDVLSIETDADGNETLVRRKEYTQAEAPLHMQESSKYSDAYQPVRPEGVSVEETLSVAGDGSVVLREDYEPSK